MHAQRFADASDFADVLHEVQAGIAEHLDARLVPELGCPDGGASLFALSPNGSREMLAVCERAVGLAPSIKGWRFAVGRQPKDLGNGLEIEDKVGRATVRPLTWSYQLRKHPADVPFDIAVDAIELVHRRTETVDAQDIVDVVLSSLLGERDRLWLFHGILIYGINESKESGTRTIPLTHLRDQLVQLGWVTKDCNSGDRNSGNTS